MLIELVAADGDAPLAVEGAEIDQFGLQFVPTAAVSRLGEPIVFSNGEDFAHNVRLWVPGAAEPLFDEDTDPAQSIEHTPAERGRYDVTCSTHPGMTAVVFVTDAHFAVVAGTDGSFVIEGVPPGSYTIRVTTGIGDPLDERNVEVTGASTEVAFGG